MRALILGAALAATTTPALAEFILSSTNVKSGSPMALAQVLDSCNGQNLSPALAWSGAITSTLLPLARNACSSASNSRRNGSAAAGKAAPEVTEITMTKS